MKVNRLLGLVAILLAVSTTGLFAQIEGLSYFPDDCALVVGVDLRDFFSLLPPDTLDQLRQQSIDEVGMDMTELLEYVAVGMNTGVYSGQSDNIYAILKGRISIEDILSMMDEKGKRYEEVMIGDLRAYRNLDSNDSSLLAAIGDGMFVAGDLGGLEIFNEVRTGKRASLTSNAEMMTAVAELPPVGLLNFAGIFTDDVRARMESTMPAFGTLTAFAFNLGIDNDLLALGGVIMGSDAEQLTAMKVMMEQFLPMAKESDPTGLAAEIIDSLEMSVEGNKLNISCALSRESLEKAIAQFGGMMGMGAEK